jgi:hypothetical protein
MNFGTERPCLDKTVSMLAPEQLRLTNVTLINRPLSEGIVVFASGMNRVADIRGAVAARVPIGVDVSKLSQAAVAAIVGSRLPVLLDSGAFSEVTVRRGEIQVVREIKEREWKRRLATYAQIAKALRQKNRQKNAFATVSVLAPDHVGSQELTLLRLSKFRREVRELQALGAAVLVPLQCGALDPVDFYNSARDTLGVEIVPAFPMKKAATTIQSILDFLKKTSVPRIHLLGMGANNRSVKALTRLVRHTHPDIQISMDANRIRAALGAQRAITRGEALHRDQMSSTWSGEVDLREWGGGFHDMTEALFYPSLWLKGAELERTAESLTWLTPQQRQDFLREPEAFVNADENQSDWLYQTLTERYFSYVRKQSRVAARTRAVFECLSASPIAHQV